MKKTPKILAMIICLTLATSPEKPSEVNVVMDGKSSGRVFEGIGALSAGASSRLLIDYPEPQRSDILDILFEPAFAVHLRKRAEENLCLQAAALESAANSIIITVAEGARRYYTTPRSVGGGERSFIGFEAASRMKAGKGRGVGTSERENADGHRRQNLPSDRSRGRTRGPRRVR